MAKTKAPKENVDKDVEKIIRGVKKISNILIGLFALGLCLKGCASCCRLEEQQRKAQEALDQKTPATLIDKSITPARCCDDKKDVTLYFDTDGNPQTAEATLDIRGLKPRKAIPFYNLTNGTTKSVFDWKNLAPMSNSSYSE